MSGIEKVYQFLDDAKTYYLATVEGDQPRVRAFGTALLYDGKLYIQTGKVKPVSHQIAANPKVEICAFKGGKWVRIAGELVNDDNREVKVAMLEEAKAIEIRYDYEGIEKWVTGEWRSKTELTQKYAAAMRGWSRSIEIKFTKVPAHSNVK